MTPVPKKKHTSGRSRRRRNAKAKGVVIPNLQPCPSCKKLKTPHRVCPHCGHYR